MSEKAIIFCDGSSLGNPGPGGWGAIVSLNGRVSEIGGGEKHTTNNKVELLAAINAIRLSNGEHEVVVHTDSSYVINGMTKWIFGWQKNNWITTQKQPVSNKELWEELINVSGTKKIKWVYVPGHVGVPGNERCDEIAVSFASGNPVKLFHGKVADYGIDLSSTIPSMDAIIQKANKNLPAYSYLSCVNGVLKKHGTWPECEREVKGVKGNVKFKKALSKEHEEEIIKEWSGQ